MPLFKKKEPESMTSLGRGNIPMDKTRELSSKGFTEAEIIDILRKEGHSAEEIDKALTSGLKAGIIESKTEVQPPSIMSQGMPALPQRTVLPTLEEGPQMRQEMPAVPETSLPQGYYYPEQYSNEEYVDYLVKEKMKEIEEKIGEFASKSGEVERRIGQVYDQLNLLVQAKPNEQQLVIAKIDGIKGVLDDLDIRVGGLERAFKEALPALIESVRALADIVQRFKREA